MEKDSIEIMGKALGAVEKLSDLKFVLYIFSAFLFLDISLLKIYGANVVSMDWSRLTKDSLGVGICMVVAYLIVMAIAIPALLLFIERLWRMVPKSSRSDSTRPTSVPYDSRIMGDYVKLNIVREKALRERDSFWLAFVQKHESLQQDLRMFATLSLAVFIFATINVFNFFSKSILVAAAHLIATMFGSSSDIYGYWVIAGFGFLILAPLYVYLSKIDETAWIEHPSLASELKNEFEKRQAEELGKMKSYLRK